MPVRAGQRINKYNWHAVVNTRGEFTYLIEAVSEADCLRYESEPFKFNHLRDVILAPECLCEIRGILFKKNA